MDQLSGRLSQKVEYSVLSSFYGALLNDNQQRMLRLYCDEDLSLSEIAKQLGVSRQSVCEGMNRAFQRLDHYEQALGLSARFQVIQKGLKDSLGCLQEIQSQDQQQTNLLKARRILQKLLDEEET